MADVNRGNRPLSPHLQVYRPQWTSMTSIAHRITGVGMLLGAILLVWWFLAAATGADAFAAADWFLTSWFGLLVLFGLTWALSFHLLNGIRHLVWDTGAGLEIETAESAGKIITGVSLLLAILIWILV